MEDAGFLRPTRTLVRWTGRTQWSPDFREAGFQVDRDPFDRMLLGAARAAGVSVFQPARAMCADRQRNGWQIRVRADGAGCTIASRLLADASGRAGWIPGRKCRVAPRTLALYARWKGVPLEGPETRVEAGEHEWYWGAPLAGDVFNTAVFVDPAAYRQRLALGGSRRALFEDLLGRSALLAPCLRGERIGGIHLVDATPCCDDEPATVDAIKVGESSFAVDPLSSQGVQTALGSALHAAAAVHTLLERPGDAALAVDFYRRAQAAAVAFHRHATTEAYREAARARSSAFWGRRAVGTVPGDGSRGAVAVDFGPQVDAPHTLTPTTVVQLAEGVRSAPAPVLCGDFIVPGTHVWLPGDERPVAFVADVEILPLLDMARAPIIVRDLTAIWARHLSGERATTLCDWLWTQGALRAAPEAAVDQR